MNGGEAATDDRAVAIVHTGSEGLKGPARVDAWRAGNPRPLLVTDSPRSLAGKCGGWQAWAGQAPAAVHGPVLQSAPRAGGPS